MSEKVKIKCVKDVEMLDGKLAFLTGVTYDAIYLDGFYFAKNEQRYAGHRLSDVFFDEHFELVNTLSKPALEKKSEELPQHVLDVLTREKEHLEKRTERIRDDIKSYEDEIKKLGFDLEEVNEKIKDIEKVLKQD